MKMVLSLAGAGLVGMVSGCTHNPGIASGMSSDIRLDHYIDSLAGDYPGLSYGATTADGLVYGRSAGLADIASGIPVADETAMNGFSLAKIVTSLAVVQLTERGLVDLDWQVSQYLPWVPYPGTVRHYLSHSAGVPNPIWGSFYIHWPQDHDSLDRDGFLRQICAENPNSKFVPGEDVLYSNLAYAILGALIEERTGMRYEQYVEENIFGPLGMDNTGMAPTDPGVLSKSYVSRSLLTRVAMKSVMKGITFRREGKYTAIPDEYYFDFPAHGGLVISPEDMGRFLTAILAHDAVLLGPEGWVRWFEPQDIAGGAFALGWRIEQTDRGTVYAHAGGAMGHAAMIRLYPEHGVATYFLSNILDSMKIEKRDMDELDLLLFGSL